MSAAVAEVVELLGQVSSGGVVQRGRAAVQAVHIVGRLTGEQKRQLAIDIAERVAPDLVPRIEAETGADLTPAQVSALLDMFRRMDQDQVQELARAVRERDASAAAVRDMVDATMAVAGIEAIAPDEPAVAPAAGPPPPPEPVSAPSPEPVSAPSPEPVSAPSPEPVSARSPRPASAASPSASTLDPTFDDLHLDWDFDDLPTTRSTKPDTAAPARGRTADQHDHATDTAGGATAFPDLLAQPAGFRRRRAAQRAIAEGAIDHADAVALCRLFDRPGDRMWIAGDLVESGMLSVADLHALLGPHDARRLAARLDRVG